MEPIVRPKRPPYYGPHPKPGQTVGFCATCRKTGLFVFTKENRLRCPTCGRQEDR